MTADAAGPAAPMAGRAETIRTAARRVLLVVASLLLLGGTIAGVANREIIDGDHFAAHADAVRADNHVAALVGQAITSQIIHFDPNLVALRPAIESVTINLVGSSAFTPIVENAVKQIHESFTHSGSGQVLLRLADLTAVLVAALKTVAPDLAGELPDNLDVSLANIGAQSYSARMIHLTRTVSLLSWLLPLLGLLCLGAAIALSRRRQRTLALCGLSVGVAGVGVGLFALIVGFWADGQHTDTLRGALIKASWNELSPAVWRSVFILVVAGLIVFAAAGAFLPQLSIGALELRIVRWVRDPGQRLRVQLVTGAILVLVGVSALYRPISTIRTAVELAGLAILAEGVARIARVAAAGRAADEQAEVAAPITDGSTGELTGGAHGRGRAGQPQRRGRLIATLGVLGLVAYVVVAAWPASRSVSLAKGSSTSTTACNGHDQLCDRRYDQVSYVTTHNSMSAADEEGWFIPEQPTGLVGQLDAGVRTLLIDTWYGQATERPGIIATAGAGRAEALAQAKQEYGAAVVDSALRLRSALNLTPHGPIEPYMCHALCELGSTKLLPAMQDVSKWLAAHPREVVTFIIEDSVSPADTASVFQQAGLLDYVYTPGPPGSAWPTLGSMISSGKRLVVFMQRQDGGTTYPWLRKAWDYIQDTPYDNASQAKLNCSRLRGDADNSLLLINNIITRFDTRVSDSAKLNAYDALYPYAARCQQERGQLPNYVAVDFYDKGNVFAVVDKLNGFG